MKLNIKLHGPLIVLPPKSMARAAVLLRMADVSAQTEIVPLEPKSDPSLDDGENAASSAPAERKVHDRLHVRFSNAQLLVASGQQTLDENWMVRETYQPTHWVLQDFQVHLTLEQKQGEPAEAPSEAIPPSTPQA